MSSDKDIGFKPNIDIFLQLDPKAEKSLFNLDKTIIESKKNIRDYIYASFGKGRKLRKTSPLIRFKKGIANRLFNQKKGLLINLIPIINSQISDRETTKTSCKKHRFHIRYPTYLYKQNIKQKKLEENNKIKKCQTTSNFLRFKHFSPDNNTHNITHTNNDIPIKNIILPDVTNTYSKIHKRHKYLSPSTSVNTKRQELKIDRVLNSSSSHPFYLTETKRYQLTSADSPQENKNIIFKSTNSQGSVFSKIKLDYYYKVKNGTNLFNRDINRTILESYHHYNKFKSNSYCSNDHFYNKKKIKKSKSPITSKILNSKIEGLNYSTNKMEQKLIELIDSNNVDRYNKIKRTLRYFKEDIGVIFGAKAKAPKNKNLTKNAVSDTIKTLKTNIIDQNKKIENSLSFIVNNLNNKQAINAMDKVIIGNLDYVNEKNKCCELRKKHKKEKENIMRLKTRLNKNTRKILSIKNEIVIRNRSLIDRLNKNIINKNELNYN